MSGAGSWAVAFGVGLLAVRLLRAGAGGLLATPALRRENFRGAPIPTAAGLLLALAVLLVEAGRSVLGALGPGAPAGPGGPRSLVVFAVVGFALLGLVDDLLATGRARGFRGHLGAALRGEVTTGFVKLVGGGALAVVLVAGSGGRRGAGLVADALLVALCANLANLLDRAPGRTLKVGLAAYVPLALALGAGPVGLPLAPVAGAACGLVLDDLRERLMLGDTGANAIGGALGLAVVLGTDETTRLVVLAVVVAANLAAEVWSFSAVIERVPPLRMLDRLGRRSW